MTFSNEPEKKLAKVKQLMALATGGATEEEARTSAFLAVKIIKAHGFEIVLPGAPSHKTHKSNAPKASKTYKTSRPNRNKYTTDYSYFENIPSNKPIIPRVYAFVRAFKTMLRNKPNRTVYSVSWMINTAYNVHVISQHERRIFERELRYILKNSNLKSKRGRNGGYYL